MSVTDREHIPQGRSEQGRPERDGPHTAGRWVRDRARTDGATTAVDDRGIALSYAELDERAQRLAVLLHANGYRIGDRLATLTGNSADHVVVFMACARAGLILAPLSWRLSARELSAQLDSTDPPRLFLVEEDASCAQPARSTTGLRTEHAAGGAQERGNRAHSDADPPATRPPTTRTPWQVARTKPVDTPSRSGRIRPASYGAGVRISPVRSDAAVVVPSNRGDQLLTFGGGSAKSRVPDSALPQLALAAVGTRRAVRLSG